MRQEHREMLSTKDMRPGKDGKRPMEGTQWVEIEPGVLQEVPHPFYFESSWQVIADWMPQGENLEIVELGTWMGAWARQVLDRFNPYRLWCVDLWGYKFPSLGVLFYKNWARRMGDNLWRNVFPLHGFTRDWGLRFEGKIDFLYVDAMHRYPSVMEDLTIWGPKVRKGGVILCHDYHMGGVARAINRHPLLKGKKSEVHAMGPVERSRSYICRM